MAYVFLSPNAFAGNISKVQFPSANSGDSKHPSGAGIIGHPPGVPSSSNWGQPTGPPKSGFTDIDVPTWDAGDPEGWVRRPIRGIQIKPDTPATLQIRRADGTEVRLYNDLGSRGTVQTSDRLSMDRENELDGGRSKYWTDWILRQVSEDRTEKTQIVETFGDSYLYVFGERPRVLKFDGYLLNSQDFNWRAEFWENWDKYMRATKLVEKDARAYINFDDIVVEGYPVNAVAVQSADAPNTINFSFSFYVTNYFNTYMAQAGTLQQMRSEGWLINESIRKGFTSATKTPLFRSSGEHIANIKWSGDIFGGDQLAVRQYFANIQKEMSNVVGSTGNWFLDMFASAAQGALTKFFYSNDFIYIRGAKTATDVANKYAAQFAQSGFRELEDMAMTKLSQLYMMNFEDKIGETSQSPSRFFEAVGKEGVEAVFPGATADIHHFLYGNTERIETETGVMISMSKQGARKYTNYLLGHLRHITYALESQIVNIASSEGTQIYSDEFQVNKWLVILRKTFNLGDTRKVADWLAYHTKTAAGDIAAGIEAALSEDDAGSSEAEPAEPSIPSNETDIDESNQTQEDNQSDQESGAVEAQNDADDEKGLNGAVDLDKD